MDEVLLFQDSRRDALLLHQDDYRDREILIKYIDRLDPSSWNEIMDEMAKEDGGGKAPLSNAPTELWAKNPQTECISDLARHDFLLTPACEASYTLGVAKQEELEFWLDVPVAAIVRWLYIAGLSAALLFLSSPLGMAETKKSRKQRQFRQTLEDPLLRRNIEVQAQKELANEDQVRAFMEELDARAASYAEEEENGDVLWRRQEAILLAWRNRVKYLWGLRRTILLLGCMSFILLLVDTPQAGVVFEGYMALISAFLGTYFLLPSSPQKSKKVSDAEEPLLSVAI